MPTIDVKINLTSWFKKYTDGIHELQMEVELGTTAAQIILKLGIPEKDIGSIIVTNDIEPELKKKVEFNYKMKNGDHILVIPPILGG